MTIETRVRTSGSSGGTSIGSTVVGGTVGSVLFIGPTGLLAEDNPAFIYDPSANDLSIGTLKLTDTAAYSSFVDSRTVPVTTSGTNVRSFPTINGTNPGDNDPTIYGLDVGFQDERTRTEQFAVSDNVFGMRMSINRPSIFTVASTVGEGENGTYNMTALLTNIVNNGLYTLNEGPSIHSIIGSNASISANGTFTLGTQTATYTAIGQNIALSHSALSLVSGTLNLTAYGIKNVLTGTTTGTTVGYGDYISVSGYDTNWGFYNASAAKNFLGTGHTIIGAAGDIVFTGASNAISGTLAWSDANGSFGAPKNTLYLSSSTFYPSFIAGTLSPELAAFFNVFQAVGGAAFGSGAPLGAGVYESTTDLGVGGLLILGMNEGSEPSNDIVLGSIYSSGYFQGGSSFNPGIALITTEIWNPGTGASGLGSDYFIIVNGTTAQLTAMHIGNFSTGGLQWVTINPGFDNLGIFEVRGSGTSVLIHTDPSTGVTLLTTGFENVGGKTTKYNAITTVSGGIPSEIATIDSTGLTANVGATTLYVVPASGEGLYRVSAYLVTTTAASVSSTMPNAQVVYTDKDSNTSVTLDISPILGAAGLGQNGLLTANTIGTIFSGTVPIYVKASTTIQYKTVNYASTAAGMAYALHIKLEAL